MDEDDELTFEQIKKIQEERKKGLLSNKSSKLDQYDTSIDTGSRSRSSSSSSKHSSGRTNDHDRDRTSSKSKSSSSSSSSKKRTHDREEQEDEDDYHQSLRKEFDSYSVPKHIIESIPIDHNEVDPLKQYRPLTVKERENKGQAAWRKRGLSPPKDYDPFTQKGDVKGKSYREIMLETQLAKEEKDLLQRLDKKNREDELLERQRKRDEERGKSAAVKESKWDDNGDDQSNKKKKVSHNQQYNSSNTKLSSSTKWMVKVFKNNDQLSVLDLRVNEPLTFGRDPKNKIQLEHQSCSSNHASITIMKEGKRPILIDLNSTNKTTLNNKTVDPYHPNELFQGDVIKFGASTREYVIHHN